MIKKYLKLLVDQAVNQAAVGLESALISRIDASANNLSTRIGQLEDSSESRIGDAIARRLFIPNLEIAALADYGEFIRHSTCSAADFFHPRYSEIAAMLHHPPVLHRKLWEWIYIIHKLLKAKAVGPGKRGLVFGVGAEKLPALFASMGALVVATDAPPEIDGASGWDKVGQHANSLENLRFPELIPDEEFDRRVTHRFSDMRAIDADLMGFDFTWSSCCFEHLGSLEAGMQFVIDSVENTLKIGGIAVHTTEFNLSSGADTVESGPTVVYRRRDIVALIERLRDRGHDVEPFSIAPDSHYLDYYVDVPPYRHNPHIKLTNGQYVTTSVGIVARRG
ncbi:MAG TPA: methyltransferase [Stellaceae bacterium]|jgi:hypothetical protein